MNKIEQELLNSGNYTLLPSGNPLLKTTFYMDFSIAEKFGESAIRDTFDRAFSEWRSDIKYMTALCVVLNWKLWDWYEKEGDESKLARLYDELWKKVDGYILESEGRGTINEKYKNFNNEEVAYFIRATD